jgi:hypothetical protein
MATSAVVHDTALALIHADADPESAIQDLLARCGDKRVAVVAARQMLMAESVESEPARRAVELLDEVLRRGPWDVASEA